MHFLVGRSISSSFMARLKGSCDSGFEGVKAGTARASDKEDDRFLSWDSLMVLS
jgi:hypothetical protein